MSKEYQDKINSLQNMLKDLTSKSRQLNNRLKKHNNEYEAKENL